MQSNPFCSLGLGTEPWLTFRVQSPKYFWLFNDFKVIKQLKMTLKNYIHNLRSYASHTQFLKTNNENVFYFRFHVRHIAILNLIRVSKINLQWNCLLALSYLLLQTIKFKKPYIEKLKSSLCSGDIQIFVFPSSPPCPRVSHCF